MGTRHRQRIETQAIHAGEPEPRICGAVSMPIFQSSTYLTDTGADYHDLGYIRLNNTPNHTVLHAKLAVLEGAEAGLVASSGMAAISTSLLTVLGSGDHILAHKCLYGGTHDLLTGEFESLGITHTFIDANDPDSWAQHLRDNTKAIYVETITNPLVEVGDLPAAARFAKTHGLISMIDNTFASPVNFRPIEHGFDLVLHSGTKYLNGHTDIVAGVVVGSAELIERVRHRLNHFGGSLDPHACFLLHRGIKTLAVRVRYQNDNALAIARFLEEHEAIERVFYPGLPSHPNHDRARELFDGFGGMLGFEPKGGVEATRRLIERVTIPISAPSLGGVETLITQPSQTSHRGMTETDRLRLGITDAVIRLSVGLEATEDLIDDFRQALG